MKLYKTVSGDTWDIISKKMYGSENFVHELIKVNYKLMDITIFSSNIEVVVPEIEIKTPNKLPPWKR